MNESDETRGIAAYALGMLMHKDASVEAAVRSVLRISYLRGHAVWRVWAQLQLTELVDEESAREEVRPILEDAFPDAERQDQIIDAALADVRKTRRTSTDAGGYYFADIGDIESDLPIFEASLLREIDIERFAQRDLRHGILNRVKNRAQAYLMAAEKGAAPPPLESEL